MTTTMKIKYVEESVRAEWQTLEDVLEHFSREEVLEICQRYMDSQKHAIAYRQRAAVKQKLMKSRLSELEQMVKQAEQSTVQQSSEQVGH